MPKSPRARLKTYERILEDLDTPARCGRIEYLRATIKDLLADPTHKQADQMFREIQRLIWNK